MAGEDQERFEDYLEFEQFMFELQAGHTAHPPQELTPTQARVYRMAMLFHAATPGVSDPTPEFAEQLRDRLEAELGESESQKRIQPVTPRQPIRKRMPRRSILAGGAVAAASALIGVSIEHKLDQQEQAGNELVLNDVGEPTVWFAVTNVANLGDQAIKFVTKQVVGYIVRGDETSSNVSERGQILALSAACTHRGCIVQWSNSDRKYHCPCHGGVFTEDGGIDPQTPGLYLTPLSRMDVKVENGQIYVRVSPHE